MEFQHKCTQCEKAFRKKSSLTKHMEYHTGSIAKPFVCDYCEKGFRLNANLAVCLHIFCCFFSPFYKIEVFNLWFHHWFFFRIKCRNIDGSIRARNHMHANIVHQIFERCPAFMDIWEKHMVCENLLHFANIQNPLNWKHLLIENTQFFC